jgi:hypothetical protein
MHPGVRVSANRLGSQLMNQAVQTAGYDSLIETFSTCGYRRC